MNKKIILFACSMLALTACSSTASGTSSSSTASASIDEVVLMDNADARVVVEDVTVMSDYYINVKMSIQNKTKNTNLLAIPVGITTNGFSLDASGVATLPPNETYMINNYFGTSMIKTLGFEKAVKYSFAYAVYNSTSTTNPIATSDVYTYYPDGEDSYVETAPVFPADMKTLIDDGNLKLTVLEVNDGADVLTDKTEPTIFFYAENKTGRKMIIHTSDMQGNMGLIELNTTDSSNALIGNAKKIISLSFDSEAEFSSFNTITCNVYYEMGTTTSTPVPFAYTFTN
jgi:hypothetical protein